MESARESWMRRWSHGAAVVVLSLVAVLLLAASAHAQQALHENPVIGEDGHLCAECHFFSPTGGVEANTENIRVGIRTMTDMKVANAGTPPAHFGCTFCHNNSSNTKMKGVKDHFTLFNSRHPIGETFNGWTGARTDTKNEFRSNINANTGVSTELECMDCHDPALIDDPTASGSYSTHVLAGTGSRAQNHLR